MKSGLAMGLFLGVVALSACSDDDDDADVGDPTSFRGNVSNSTAFLAPSERPSTMVAWWRSLGFVGTAHAQVGGVRVCIEGTATCTTTDANGSFVLNEFVGGDVCLTFDATNFDARLCFANLPPGAIVTMTNISCSTSSGTCTAGDVDVDEPSASDDDISDLSTDEVSDDDFPSPSEPDASDFDTSDPDDISDPSDDDFDDFADDDI